jgi:hypothetical protein
LQRKITDRNADKPERLAAYAANRQAHPHAASSISSLFLNRTFRSSRWSTTNTSQIPLIGIYVGKPIVKGGGAD